MWELKQDSSGHVQVRLLKVFSALHLAMNDFEVLIWGYTISERVGDCRNMESPNNKDPPYIKMTHCDRCWEENEVG